MGPRHQHAFPAGGDHRVAAQEEGDRPAAGDRDHRLRDASPVGQSAVRPLLHRHARRGRSTCNTGACRRPTRSSPAFRFIRFQQAEGSRRCIAKHGLADDRPIVLQLAGGFGVGPIEKIFHGILSVEQPIQLVTIAGRNEKLKDQLSKIKPPPRHKVKVMGFTKEIDELMEAADLVVSKPGGLTTSEALARGAVMVIVNPIPGQESRNSDYLLESGAAIKANNIATLAYKVNALLEGHGAAGAVARERAPHRQAACGI